MADFAMRQEESAQTRGAGACFPLFCSWIVQVLGDEACNIVLIDEEFDKGLRAQMTEEAGRIWFRILLEEFHSFRDGCGLPDSPESAEALSRFDAHLASVESRHFILDAWPSAASLTRARFENIARYASEVEQAYARDRSRLVESGFIGGSFRVAKVRFAAGDSHEGGKTVTIVTGDDGQAVVFKPRSNGADQLLADICSVLSNFDPIIDLSKCVPRTLQSENGLWQEYIHSEDLSSPEQLSTYFVTFGALAALCCAIGAVDLHHENVVVRGDSPCIVDSETILQPEQSPFSDQVRDRLLHAGEHSPGATLMLPMRVRNGAFDILICALGLPWEQESEKDTFAVIHEGSDAVQLARVKVRMRHDANVLRFGEEEINPLDHVEEIVHGYLSVVRALSDNHGAIAEILARAENVRFRVVPRPTEVYAKFLDASVHPSLLVTPDGRMEVLDVLRPLEIDEELSLLTAEREDLRALDVPVFFTSGSSQTLSWRGEVESPEIFAKTPVQAALCSLEAFVRRPRKFHQLMLETSLNELSVGLGVPYPSALMTDALSLGPRAVSSACRELLHETAVIGLEGEKRAAGWISNLGHEGLSTFEIDTVHSFHDFGGVVEYLSARHPRTELAQLASALPAARDERGDRPSRPWSVFSGPSSSLFAGRLPDTFETELSRFPTRARDFDVDLIGGLSGLLATGSASPLVTESWIEEARDTLQRAYGTPLGRPWHDLAHGRIGLDWALARAAHRLGCNEEAEEIASRIRVNLARSLAEEELGAAWCSGASGLLIVASDLFRLGLDDGKEIETLSSLAAPQLSGPVDLSICHGISGSVQSLRFAAEVGALKDGSARSNSYWGQAMAAATRHGFHTGVIGRTTVLGYLLGWAGVADTADRLVDGTGTFDPVALIPARQIASR